MTRILLALSLLLFTVPSYAAILSYGESGVGTTVYTTVNQACNAAGIKKVVVTSPQTLAANTTCPVGVELRVEMGGVITTTGYID